MATLHGWEKAKALEKLGWTIKQEEEVAVEEMRFGDPIMVDYLTGIEYTPYEAEKIQEEREEWKPLINL